MKNDRNEECLKLASEILKNIELSEIPFDKVILKGLRLTRLLKDEDGNLLFSYESGGYPKDNDGYLTSDAWRISKIAGRHYYKKSDEEKYNEYAFTETIASMAKSVFANEERLRVATDPSSYSGGITPLAISYTKNTKERTHCIGEISSYTEKIQKVSGALYSYILNIYNELVFSDKVYDIFERSRMNVDLKLSKICPDSIKKFLSVYENLESENPEDWANAVHSCRRILKEFADSLYPPSSEKVEINGKTIKVGEDNYINRLILFIESKSGSSTYTSVVGSNLENIGKRLDSLNNAVCKGTHSAVEKYNVHIELDTNSEK